ncbi:MAG: hypothetical protein HZA50_13270 [Planctomycetes bacterium]|nr:hypothetical protein [Planctomycetota bacterium]
MRSGAAIILLACAATALILVGQGLTENPPAGTTVAPAPKPSDVPFEWELAFTYKDPMCIRVKAPGEEKARIYWYMLYRVINRTKEDQNFIPEFAIYTNTGEILQANKNIPTAVYDAIKQLHNLPLLKDQTSVTGKLLQGEDNAKEGVAMWPDIDPQAGTFDVFVGGLSGELADAALLTPMPPAADNIPASGPAAMGYRPKPPASAPTTKKVLTKQLRLQFMITGDQPARLTTPVTFKLKEWVMR